MENGFELSLHGSALYGYQFLRADLPPVERICLLVGEGAPKRNGELELSFEPRVFPLWKKKLGELRKGERIFVPRLGDGLAEVLLGNHGGALEITCVLKDGEELLAKESLRIPICDFCEFCGADNYLGLTASFVTPDALAVRRLARDLPQKRSGGTGRYARREILALVREIYGLLQRRELTYSIHGFRADRKGERLRLPALVLKEKTANAAELAFVFASVAEAAGLDAVLIWRSTSVAVGIYTGEPLARGSEILDVSLLQNCLRSGDLMLVDPADVCYGSNVPLSLSEKNAREALESAEDFLGAVDVSAAREEGIFGIPSELYEQVSDEYADRLLPAEDPQITPVESARRSLLCSSRARSLLAQSAVVLPMEAEQALAESVFSFEDAQGEPRTCLGLGRVEYQDPLYEESVSAYLLFCPLVRREEGGFEKTDAPILNTLLLERLSVLYGLYAAPVEEAFAREGYPGASREVEADLAGKEGVSFFASSCARGSFDPYPCLSYDSLRALSPSSPSEKASWAETGLSMMDREADEARKTAQANPLTLITSEETQLREELVLELTARAMAAGRRVKLISPRGARIGERLAQEAARAPEQAQLSSEKYSYFDQLFFVHPHGYSFYQAHLLWDKYSHAPELPRIPSVLLEGMDPEAVAHWSKVVSELTETWEGADGVKDHPLGRVENPFYGEEHKQQARGLCQRVCLGLKHYLEVLEQLKELFALEGEITLDWARRMAELLKQLQEAEEVPYYYYRRRDDRLAALVETGRRHAALRAQLEERFHPSVFRLDASRLQESLRAQQGFSLLRGKSPKKAALQSLRACVLGGSSLSETQAEETAEQLVRCEEYAAYLCDHAEELKACFGVDVLSPDGEQGEIWRRLGELCRKGEAVWEAYRPLERADEEKLSKLCQSEELCSRLAQLESRLGTSEREWKAAYGELRELLSLRENKEQSLPRLLESFEAMEEKMDSLREWTQWLRARSAAAGLGLASVVEQCESGRFTAEELKLNFLCGFFRAVAEHVRSHSPALEHFDPEAEWEGMKDYAQYARDVFSCLCRDALEQGSLEVLSLREAARAAVEEGVSLLLVDGGEKLCAKETVGLLAKGDQIVIFAAPWKDCTGSSLAQTALRMGAKEARLSLSYDQEPLFSRLALGFASDCGYDAGASAYPILTEDSKAEVLRVNGGYDEQTGTNVIEASVIVDELLQILEEGSESVTVVCFGEAQRKLVTLLLAKRLAALPELAERYLADPGRFVVCALGEEAPRADRVFVSLCFSCAHGKYGEGLSGKLSPVLGEAPCSALMGLFFLAKRRLCFTLAFTAEELVNTRCTTEPMRIFSHFARRLFSLSRLSADTRDRELPCEKILKQMEEALEKKGFSCRRNAGFSSAGVALLVEDPREKGRTAVAVVDDGGLQALCSDPVLAAEYLEGYSRRGIGVFRLSSLAWYCDKEAVIRNLLALLEKQVGQADWLMQEMGRGKTE